MDPSKNERLIRLAEVIARTGRSRSSIYSDVRAGLFPPPVGIGARSVAWRASAIDAWIAERSPRGGTDGLLPHGHGQAEEQRGVVGTSKQKARAS
jgi:prophage regulatory protein